MTTLLCQRGMTRLLATNRKGQTTSFDKFGVALR